MTEGVEFKKTPYRRNRGEHREKIIGQDERDGQDKNEEFRNQKSVVRRQKKNKKSC